MRFGHSDHRHVGCRKARGGTRSPEKNDGAVRSLEARLEAEIPAGATFVSCRMIPNVPCTRADPLVTVDFVSVAAHATVRMTLTLRAPDVTTTTNITLRAKFSGENIKEFFAGRK